MRRLLKQIIACAPFASRPDPIGIPNEREEVLIKELRDAFSRLPSRGSANRLPSERTWDENISQLRDLVAHQDPRAFLNWDVIERTMFIRDARYLKKELEYLLLHPAWEAAWKPALNESQIGQPPRFPGYPISSGTLIHHAYHVARFLDVIRSDVSDFKSIVEFGGGYGSMCRLFLQLGFRGNYFIFDLPEFSALQHYYLQSLGIQIVPARSVLSRSANVVCVSDMGMLIDLVRRYVDPAQALFIATWSLSESPTALRDEIGRIVHGFRYFLIAFQHRFGEVDNVAYFEQWIAAQNEVAWKAWEIEHMTGHYYLMGARLNANTAGVRDQK